MQKSFLLATLFLSTIVTGISPGAYGAVLASDNFVLSTGINVGSVTNTQASGVGTYTTILGTGGMSVTTVSGFGTGNVLSFSNSTNNYYRAFNDSTSLTLNSLGVNHKLTMSFDVRFDGSFGGADNFSFGFVNTATPNSILYANLDLSALGGTPSEFRYRTTSYNMSDAGIIVGSSFTEPTTTSTTAYTFELSVTKLANNGFLLEYLRDGVLIGSTTQAANSAFATTVGNLAISGIAFRHSQTPGVTTYIDNVTAMVVVPEPWHAGIALAGLTVLVVLRRRSRIRNAAS